MAVTQDVVRRLTIEATDRGLNQTTDKLERLRRSQESIVTSSGRQERATQSVERRLESLQRRYDESYRAQQALARVQRDLQTAQAQGLVTQQRAAEIMQLAIRHHNRAAQATKEVTTQTGLARHEMINLSRQVQDIGVSLASGQSPFTVLVQQGTQVADIFGNTTGTLRGFAGQILGLITPMRALAGVIALGTAGAIAMTVSWRNFALQLDDIARRAGVATEEMAKLQAVASFRGISQQDFSSAMERFADQVYRAQHGMGDLARMFRANGVQARTFTEFFERAADVIARAKTDQERLILLQRMGLPANMQWVRLMSQGSDGIRRAREEAARFGGEVNDEMVRKSREVDVAWNRFWTNFSFRMKMAVVEMADFGRKWGSLAIGLLKFTNPATVMSGARDIAGALGPATPNERVSRGFETVALLPLKRPDDDSVNDELLAHRIQREQQRISILGQLASVQDLVKQKENEITLARLAGVPVTEKEARAILDLTRYQAEAHRMMEALTLGIFNEAQARRIAEQEIDIAKRRGLIKTVEDEAAAREVLNKRIREMGEAARVARSGMEELTRYSIDATNLTRQIDQAATSAFRSFEDSFADFVMGTKSAKEAFTDMANSIIRDLIRIAVRQSITGPLANMLLGGFGGGGFGSLFGGGGGGFALPGLYHTGGIAGAGGAVRYVHPAYFENAPRFHSGGIAPGEIPAVLRPGEEVLTTDDPRHRFNGGGARVQIEVGVFVNDDGTLGVIAREAGRQGGAEAADVRVRAFSGRELPDRMRQIEQKPRRRGMV